MKRAGLALIVVLCVLGVLAILGVAFVTMARLERRASQQRIHATRALLLARSGIEDAMARLSAGQDASRTDTRYCGEDFDANGVMNAGLETAEQRFNPSSLDTDACPLDQALRPSFFVHDRTGAGALPALTSLDGRWRGYSGRLGQPSQGASYALKLEDESAKINVNGGFLDARDRDNDGIPDHRDHGVRLPTATSSTGTGWNDQLGRILGILGNQPELNLPTLGMDVLSHRPQGGYRSIEELQQLLGLSAVVDLSPYLTVSSWTDLKVVRPNAPSAPTYQFGRCMNEVKRSRAPLALEAQGRPPVNLNRAPRPVLQALVQDLSGTTFAMSPGSPVTAQVTPAVAGLKRPGTGNAIVEAILSRRASAPFSSWPDFCAFCDGLAPAIQAIRDADPLLPPEARDLRDATFVMDVVKANFDPNTGLNKQLPDQILWRWIDKSDLTAWSTEGSLGPTGIFEVASEGRLLGENGKLLASCVLRGTVEAFTLLRQTTQRDFVAGRSPDSGDTSYLSQASGTCPTAGASAGWNAWAPGQGLAVLTYPCPMPALPPAADHAADFDGCIALATVEHRDPGPAGMRFLHHLNGWDADRGGARGRLPGPNGASLQTDPKASAWPASGEEPSTLCPDGAYVQNGHCPAFPARGNLPDTSWVGGTPGNHGVISLWSKNNPIDVYQCVASVLRGSRSDVQTQALVLGYSYLVRAGCGICTESAKGPDLDERLSFVTSVQDPSLGRRPQNRWRLITAFFDTNEYGGAMDLRASSASVAGVFTNGPASAYGPTNPAHSGDLLWDAETGTDSLLVLGNHGRDVLPICPVSNAVLDEFAVYDFGDEPGLAMEKMDHVVLDRFADGRYYKENDARFLSGVLVPVPGSPVRLLGASWTVWLPREVRKEFDTSLIRVRGDDHEVISRLVWTAADRQIDPSLLDADVQVDLLPRNGTQTSGPLQEFSQAGRIGRLLEGFRYRVTFKPTPLWTPEDRFHKPVLETPFFDDITFAYQGASGPRVLSWNSP